MRDGLPETNTKPSSNQEAQRVPPFLKWAGGKRWLAPRLAPSLKHLNGAYIEPFAGSAAIFFHLNPSRAILSDTNQRLIETYKAVRKDPESVQKALTKYQKIHSDEFYYRERSRARRSRHMRAAQFIYLNRTCWNGLYRENLNGEFNVPRGTKNKVVLPDDNWIQIASYLKNSAIICADFERTIKFAGKGDFILADPPYAGPPGTNTFTKYGSRVFSWNDQARLASALKSADSRGATFLVTNTPHTEIRDIFDEFAYTFNVKRHSIISGKPKGRSQTEEIFITNDEKIAKALRNESR